MGEIPLFIFKICGLLIMDLLRWLRLIGFAPLFPLSNYSGIYKFWQKLKRLKQTLRWWNKNIFGNIFSKIIKDEDVFINLEKIYANDQIECNKNSFWDAKSNLLELHSREEIYWIQKLPLIIFLNGIRILNIFMLKLRK